MYNPTAHGWPREGELVEDGCEFEIKYCSSGCSGQSRGRRATLASDTAECSKCTASMTLDALRYQAINLQRTGKLGTYGILPRT